MRCDYPRQGGPISAVLRSADFAAVNLETAATGRGAPQPKTYHFRTSPGAFTVLRDAGIDLVTMANDRCPDERFHADEDAVPYVADELSLTTALATAARAPGE